MSIVARLTGFAVLLAVAAACGSSDSATSGTSGPQVAPVAVIDKVEAVAAAAGTGEAAVVAELAAEGFEFDLDRPDITLHEHLEAGDERLLELLGLLTTFEPARRQSPFGNGAVQELWIYPGFALAPPSTWSESLTADAIENGLFTADDLADYELEGAYLGLSIGFSPTGEWIFFTSGRVAATTR